MHRESVYLCTYRAADGEHVAHVRAWDVREAAEICASELQLDPDAGDVRITDIRVRPASATRAAAA